MIDFDKAPDGVDQETWDAFLNCKIKFWTCKECERPTISWDGDIATCDKCGKNNAAQLQVKLTAARARVEELERERDAAIAMLANWCIHVDINGSGWDDWDEAYKNAMHRPCSIRSLLDTAIAKERKKWKEEYGRE